MKKSNVKNIEKVEKVMRKFSSNNNLRKAMRKNYRGGKNETPSSSDEGKKDSIDFNRDIIMEAVKNYASGFYHHSSSERENDKDKAFQSNSKPQIQINPIQKQIFGKNNQINIIICDDDTNITSACEKILKKAGNLRGLTLNIDKVHNGIECLYKIYQESIQNKYYEILFIDETMPMIKGSTVIKVLKGMIEDKQMKEILIYSVTSFGEENAIEEIKKSGCDAVLQKPLCKEVALNIFKELRY